MYSRYSCLLGPFTIVSVMTALNIAPLCAQPKWNIYLQDTAGTPGLWTMSGRNITGFDPVSGPVSGWKVAAAADLDHDGIVDIILEYKGAPFDGWVGVWYMTGQDGQTIRTFNLINTTTALQGWNVVAFADVDHDGNQDMVVQKGSSGEVDVWRLGSGPGDIALLGINVILPTSGLTAVAVCDINGDGNPDVLLQSTDLTQIDAVYLDAQGLLLYGPFLFITNTPPPGQIAWGIIGAFDVNGDGISDFVITNDPAHQNLLGVWYWNGVNITGFDYLANPGAAGYTYTIPTEVVVPLTLSQFRDCIGANVAGYNNHCLLSYQSDAYPINNLTDATSYLSILRSNIIVDAEWPYPTLQRTSATTYTLMATDNNSGHAGVTIMHFAFDGNRGEFGLIDPSTELDLKLCAYCQVYYSTFQNSTDQAITLHTEHPSAVVSSVLSNAYRSGIYTGDGRCPDYATWSPSFCQNIINNHITLNGGGGVGLNSSQVNIFSNLFTGNDLLCSDGVGAGQIGFTPPEEDTVTASYNTITNGPQCPFSGTNTATSGIEFHGTNATFSNNRIENNSGDGIYLESAQNVTISSDTPANEALYPIRNNNTSAGAGHDCGGWAGIELHTIAAPSRTAQNITINNIWAVGGHSAGVEVDSCNRGNQVGPPINYITVTNSCFAGNQNTGNQGVLDKFNCGNGFQSCIGVNSNISGNQVSSCGGY